MPDRIARPMTPGVDRDPEAYLCAAQGDQAVLLASYGRRGGQTDCFRAVCITPDEARRLGIALVCAADRAEEITA